MTLTHAIIFDMLLCTSFIVDINACLRDHECLTDMMLILLSNRWRIDINACFNGGRFDLIADLNDEAFLHFRSAGIAFLISEAIL